MQPDGRRAGLEPHLNITSTALVPNPSSRIEPEARRGPGAILWRLRLPLACLLFLLPGCAETAPGGGPYPRYNELEGERIGRVVFAGDPILPVDSLHAVVEVSGPECRIAFLPRKLCIAGVDWDELELTELAGDVVRLQLYYRDHGYYGSRVVPSVERSGPEEVTVRFAIAPGDRVMLTELLVDGAEEILPEEQILRELPLRLGQPFRRRAFLAAADTLRSLLQRRGHAYAEVLRNYSIDTIADVAEVGYVAVPGPVVRVDSVRILGADRLARRTVMKQLTVREGEILDVRQLGNSQRSLYQLGMVNFATVELAPDSLQIDPEPTTATVITRIVEAAKYVTTTGVGYGSIDCLRAGARATDRNFLGGGRTLEVSASAGKIGIGAPLDFGLDGSLCRTLRRDPFSDELTYRLAADFLQPRLLGTRTQLSAGLHAERQSELLLFLRNSIGGNVALSREVGAGMLLSTGLQVDRGSTEASPAIFCALFAACAEEEQRLLADTARWSNAATLSFAYDRTELLTSYARGYQLRTGFAWASPLVGSDDRYLSVLGDAVAYYPVKPGWLLAGRLHGGQFLTGGLGLGDEYIPPERRFYAGGPNSVRGFPANALGPQAYIAEDVINLDASTQRYPLGGTRMFVGSVELRTPSPFLSEYLRLATFVDAGQVWAPGVNEADRVITPTSGLRITPGMGIRITTPVGPVRVDVAYNRYAAPLGPRYLTIIGDEGEPLDLILENPSYAPQGAVDLDRFQFHIAVGQAF